MYEISRIFDFSDFLFFLMISLTFFINVENFQKYLFFPQKTLIFVATSRGFFVGVTVLLTCYACQKILVRL